MYSSYRSCVNEPIINGPTPDSVHIAFDPDKHLDFHAPEQVLTWEDLGYPKDHGISPIAASQPFRLFSKECIQHMRAEMLQPEVIEKFRVASTITAMQVRGYAESHAPFIYSAWKHPRTMEILSAVAGMDLSIRMDHEIGHLNFAVKSDDSATALLDDSGEAYMKEKEVVGWHLDSYPFSSITMLSDATDMESGETVLKKANGEQFTLNRPQLGDCCVLQGRYVLHKGLTASAGKERISMVTSLWPASALVRDESMLTNSSDEMYVQFVEYRLGMLEERIRFQLEEVRTQRQAGQYREAALALNQFVAEQQKHLEVTARAL